MALPDYQPPCARRACVAASGAPLLVLLGFTGLVCGLLAPDSLLALLAAATVWVGWELHDWQRRLDHYDADYIARHLAWRAEPTLRGWLHDGVLAAATGDFVQRYLDGGRLARLRDGLPV